MRRNYTPDQELVDQLLTDSTFAFEELIHRYWFPLYTYSYGKMKSKDDAKKIVTLVFSSLWNERNHLPVNFSISSFLYSEVRAEVVKCVNAKMETETENSFIEKEVLPGFNTDKLYKARRPVEFNSIFPKPGRLRLAPVMQTNKETWWDKQYARTNLKGLKHALQTMLNF